MPTILVSEKITGGPVRNEFKLEIATHRITVRELIKNCVDNQASVANSGKPKSPFFSPALEETELNEEQPNKGPRIDSERQFLLACDAFSSKKVLLLLDGTQETELDKEVTIKSESRIVFLQLVPLAGG